jgi:DNA-directed RNA polymerase specialized sigma24 family protein
MDANPLEEWDHPAVYDEYDIGVKFKNQKLDEAYSNLKPIYREIIDLVWLEDHTEEQIMELLDMKRQSVRQRRFRAKEQLEEQLGTTNALKAARAKNRAARALS